LYDGISLRKQAKARLCHAVGGAARTIDPVFLNPVSCPRNPFDL